LVSAEIGWKMRQAALMQGEVWFAPILANDVFAPGGRAVLVPKAAQPFAHLRRGGLKQAGGGLNAAHLVRQPDNEVSSSASFDLRAHRTPTPIH
jgi:hypothetical protein